MAPWLRPTFSSTFTFSLLLFPFAPVLTACGVQAFILQPQSFYWLSADDVLLDDFIHVSQRDAGVPDGLGIDDDIRPVLTLIEASCLVGTHSAFQSALGKFHFE